MAMTDQENLRKYLDKQNGRQSSPPRASAAMKIRERRRARRRARRRVRGSAPLMIQRRVVRR